MVYSVPFFSVLTLTLSLLTGSCSAAPGRLRRQDDTGTGTPAPEQEIEPLIACLEWLPQTKAYAVVARIGTPERDFRLMIDTSFSDTWVYDERPAESPGTGNCSNPLALGQQSSSTLQYTNNTVQIPAADGNHTLTTVTDNVIIANATLPGLPFGVVDFPRESSEYDGMLGLGYSPQENSFQKIPGPADFMASGIGEYAVVAFKVNRQSDGGEIAFNKIPSKERWSYDPKTSALVPNVGVGGGWAVALDGAQLTVANGDPIALPPAEIAIISLSSPHIYAPPADVNNIHQAIGAAVDSDGNYVIPCDTTAFLSFMIGGQPFSMQPSDLILGPVDAANPEAGCYSSLLICGEGECTSGWNLGSGFFKSALIALMTRENKVALAVQPAE